MNNQDVSKRSGRIMNWLSLRLPCHMMLFDSTWGLNLVQKTINPYLRLEECTNIVLVWGGKQPISFRFSATVNCSFVGHLRINVEMNNFLNMI